MDIGRAFSYILDDPNWVKKVLIGGVVNIIPIVSFASTGYWLTQTKNAYEGRELPLPEWSDFGGYFMKGLMAVIATFVYFLPAILIYCCAFIVPTFLAGAGSSTGDQGSASAGPMATVATLLFFCGICVLLIYLLVLLLFVPALLIRYALSGEFGALFQFGPAWQLIRANLGSYIMALLVFVIASMIAGIVGGIACGVGAFFTSFWSSLVGAYLFGNFAKGAPQTAPTMA